jgi:DNA-directed RNA polymerase subunit N (RpoN/RPB10)
MHWENAEAVEKERREFADLQQMIDDLTREKYEMERAVMSHSRLVETLAEENLTITEQVRVSLKNKIE